MDQLLQTANQILQTEFFDNPLRSYCIALISLVSGLVLIRLFQRFGLKRIRDFAQKTRFRGDDILIKVLNVSVLPVLYFWIVYVSLQSLRLNQTLATAVDAVGAGLVAICCILGLQQLLEYSLGLYYLSSRDSEEKRAKKRVKINLILPAVRVILWTIGIIFLLQNLGYDLSAVVASLGIGGIAVALASQGLLQDLFSYFAIIFDDPFSIGDFIIVDEFAGTVRHIGIKTTRLESLSGETLVFPNQFLTSNRIQNYQEMKRRRIVFRLGVIYDTSREKLMEIPRVIQEIIQSIEGTEFERCHFFQYGASSLDFETVYYVLDQDYGIYMNIQQQINFAIWDAFKYRDIEFAYPSQTLYLEPQWEQGGSAAQNRPVSHPSGNSPLDQATKPPIDSH